MQAMHILESPRNRAQVLLAALAIGILFAVGPFLSGLLGAAVLYVAAAPAYRRLVRHVSPRVSASLMVVATVTLVCVPALWLVSAAVAEAPGALQRIHDSAAWARIARLRVAEVELGSQVAEVGRIVLSWVSARALDGISGLVRGTLNLIIALFGLFFLLLSGRRAADAVAEYLPFSPAHAEVLRTRFVLVTEATLLGTALTAVLQGAVVGAGFWLVGLPSPLFWGAVTALVSILPIMGSALVWLPGALVLVAQQRYGAALALGVIGAVVASNIDNVMRPVVNRRVSDLHPMVTIVGAFAGVNVFGLAGLLLGPLAISYFFELVRIYRNEYGEAASGARPESPSLWAIS